MVKHIKNAKKKITLKIRLFCFFFKFHIIDPQLLKTHPHIERHKIHFVVICCLFPCIYNVRQLIDRPD